MIAIDTNILVYAHRFDSPWNERAFEAIRTLVASGAPWAIPWHCLYEFYAIASHPKLYKSTREQATKQIDYWLGVPSLTMLAEDRETWEIVADLVAATKLVGPGVYDARIAALCIQHHVTELWSCDRDFSRFPSVRVRNPLVDPLPLPTRAGERRVAYRMRGAARATR